MAHFTKDYLAFLRGLARNNTREWFHANKARYESAVKVPFRDFVEEMIHRVSAIDSSVVLEPKDAIFRIARDIRFSKDKTPYKTHMSAVVNRGGRKDHRSPGLYFQLGASNVAVAGGVYQPDKSALYNIRAAIRDRGTELDRLVKSKAFRERFGELMGDKNKVLPKEFKDARDRFPLIANKQFYYWVEHPADTLLRDDLAAFLMEHYRAGKKVGDWLAAAAEG